MSVSAPPNAMTNGLSSLREVVDQVQASLDSNASIMDMRGAGSLELQLGSGGFEDPTRISGQWPVSLLRLEDDPVVARVLPDITPGSSRFRYFLDGSQHTLPVWRIDLLPITVSLCAVGILERTEEREVRLLPQSLRVHRTWIVPTASNLPQVEALVDQLQALGEDVRDPLLDRNGARLEQYDQLLGHYSKMVTNAQQASSDCRAQLEFELLQEWSKSRSFNDDSAWMVVDGRLPRDLEIANAIGLVKDLQTQHFMGREASALFSLSERSRTSAFRYVTHPDDDGVVHEDHRNRTMWYQRMWNPVGQDARHSLIRLEAPHAVEDSAQIDELATWLLEERLPRAANDTRWPTLLYPIHLLERMLKRQLNGMLTGWPSHP